MSIQKTIETAFNNIEYAVRNIDRYQSRFERLSVGTYSDIFGSFRVNSPSTGSQAVNFELGTAFRLKSGSSSYKSIMSEMTIAPYVDYGNSRVSVDFGGSTIAVNPICLILPPEGSSYNSNLIVITEITALQRGLVLSRQWNYHMSYSDWLNITVPYTVQRVVKCPPDTLNLPYLNKLPMRANVIEEIIDNLHDYSGTTKTEKLVIGSDNIAKLSESQKQKLFDKNWTLG